MLSPFVFPIVYIIPDLHCHCEPPLRRHGNPMKLAKNELSEVRSASCNEAQTSKAKRIEVF
jgi:hypothetical protein